MSAQHRRLGDRVQAIQQIPDDLAPTPQGRRTSLIQSPRRGDDEAVVPCGIDELLQQARFPVP